jgi:ubiquinone/menaquinone biosynthesis C-methylase UbiE
MSGDPGLPKSDAWSAIHAPDSVARAADRLARFGGAPSEIAARARFLECLDLRPGSRVLDVGAGTGVLTLDIAARVAPDGGVVALDNSPELLALLVEAARERGVAELIKIRAANAREMPFVDGGFDCAICHWLLLHVDLPRGVVCEMVRVVRPGGTVMCVEVDWETAIVHPGDRDLTRRILHASCDRHVDGWSGRRLVPWLRAAGLEQVECLPIVDVEAGQDGDTWPSFLEERAGIAVECGAATEEEARSWWREIDAARRAGIAFFSLTQFAVWGRVGPANPAARGLLR